MKIPLPGKFKERREILLFGLAFLFLFLALFHEFFFTDRLFYSRDMAFLEVPLRQHAATLMKEGGGALWTDAYGNGQPFLANPKNAVLYPGTWLYVILPFGIAFKLHFFLHGVLAWAGLFLLSRSLQLSSKASFLAASTFFLGGYLLSSFEFYNHLASLAWLPWLLLVARTNRSNPFMRTLWLVGLWVLLILSGTPHVIPMAILLGILLIIITGDHPRPRLRAFGLSFALAILLAAIQLLPAVELLSRSSRDPQETLRWSLEPVQLVNLVVPGIFGNDRGTEDSEYWGGHLFDYHYPLYYSLYASPGLLLLAMIGLRKPRTRVQLFLAISAAVFLLVSLANFLPFFAFVAKLPGAGLIRYPVKYLGGTILALSFLGAIGFDRFFSQGSNCRRTAGFFMGFGILAALTYVLGSGPILRGLSRLFAITDPLHLVQLRRALWYTLAVFLLFGLILLVSSRVKALRPALGWAFLALLVADLGISNRGINPVAPVEFFAEPAFLKGRPGPLRVFRDGTLPDNKMEQVGHDQRFQSYLRQSLCPYTLIGPVHYVYDQDFYALYPKDYTAVVKKLRGADREARQKILADAGASFSVSHRSLLRSGLPPRYVEEVPVYFEPVARTRKFPYSTTSVIRTRSFTEALGYFDRPGFDPLETTVVDSDIHFSGDLCTDAGLSFSPLVVRSELMSYTVKAPRSALAVFCKNPVPGWQARLDGRPAPIVKAGLFSLGIVVPEGTHSLEIRYRPASVMYGLVISLLTLNALMACLIIRTFRGRDVSGAKRKYPSDAREAPKKKGRPKPPLGTSI